MTAPNDLFIRARDADIEAVAGVKLYRAGRRMRGECPICGASKGKRIGGAFSIEPDAGLYYCFACLRGGDVVDLEHALRGGTPREAAERLVGAAAPMRTVARPAAPAASSRPEPSPADRMARQIWDEAHSGPILETLGARYLLARHLDREILGRLGPDLRFHAAAPWGWDGEARRWITAPALVGRIRTPAGPTGGVHVTYLAGDGRGKARLDPAKRMWGAQGSADGRPGGLWLIGPDGDGPLVVGEGLESGLSAVQLLGRPARLVATLSLRALQGGWATDSWGRIDPAMPAGDPAKPAFTWPGDWPEVLVGVDRDMRPIKVKVRKLGGGTAERLLEAEDRARICAGLAVAAWRGVGANVVRAIAPGPGRDFNDELRERLA